MYGCELMQRSVTFASCRGFTIGFTQREAQAQRRWLDGLARPSSPPMADAVELLNAPLAPSPRTGLMQRVCSGVKGQPCGRITPDRRCPEHARLYEAARTRRSKGHYDAAWRRVRARAIREQPWCRVCRTPGTPDNPLTGDHVQAWAHGGTSQRANVEVLCRRCNSRKGTRRVQDSPS
jgi:5-methylcytosine-specific restriction endonuclease McrA